MKRIKLKSPITLFFCAMCIFAYLIGTPDAFVLGSSNMFSMVLWIFGHKTFSHLTNNLMFILILGPIIEDRYDSSIFITLIIITALLTATLHILLFDYGLLGASGIVFMMIVLSAAGTKNGEIPLTFILVILVFIGKEFISSIKPGQVSYFAHIIGGLLGGLFGLLIPKTKDGYIKNIN